MPRGTTTAPPRIPHWNWRVWTGLIVATFLGGVVSMLIGTGVNVLLFLFAVTMAGLHPRVGVASSIVTMAGLSVLGFVVLGIAHGQLDVELAASGDVVAVGGEAASPLSADRYDLLGLWIAAIPVVAWDAPLGTYVVHLLAEHRLIAFVDVLAGTEVVSTLILLDDLHSDPALIAYAVGGLLTLLVGVRLPRRYRREILDLPAAEPPTELAGGAAGREG